MKVFNSFPGVVPDIPPMVELMSQQGELNQRGQDHTLVISLLEGSKHFIFGKKNRNSCLETVYF